MHVKLSSPCRARMRVHATAKDHRPYLLKPELKVRMRSDVISLQRSAVSQIKKSTGIGVLVQVCMQSIVRPTILSIF